MWTTIQLLAVSLTITSIARCTVTASPILIDADHSIVKSSRTMIGSSMDDDDDNDSPALPVATVATTTPFSTTTTTTATAHKGIGCASPEVLVNGSPSPDILETVNGGNGGSGSRSGSSSASSSIGNIQEIQFVGASVAVATAGEGGNADAILPGREKRRICKIKCLNGVWVGPLCIIESECPSITSGDVNLRISSDGNKVHDETRFSCLDGYRLKGFQEVICTSSGSWSHPVPSCEAIQCPEIQSNDPNLQIWSQDRNFSATASFSCPDGFNLQGAASVTCNSNGSWSNLIPYCEVSTCQPLIPPSDGRLLQGSGYFKAGDYVEFSCDPGFQMMGSSLSVCLENGSWSQSVPQCKRVCLFPGEPGNGYIQPTKFHYDIGDGVSIICKQDYEAIGPAFIYCTSAGTWSSPLTTCQKYSSRPDLDDVIF